MKPRRALSTATLLFLIGLGFWKYQAPAQNTRREDYLTPELRAAVEQLKRDAAATPTNTSNMVARGKLVYDWLNAYSLTGGPIPVNATQQLAAVYALEAGEDAPAVQTTALPATVDALIYELRIKDERPEALPVAELDQRGPFPADSYQTIRQTVTAGTMGFQVGATVLAARQFGSDSGVYQNTNPAADNYVTIQSATAQFEPEQLMVLGMHGGFRGAQPGPAFRMKSGRLEKGDRIVLTYGDKSGGSRGLKMQTYANDRVLLPVYVDPEAKKMPLTLAWQGFQVAGNAATQLRVIAPSVLQTGETFEVSIRGEDRLWNRSSGTLPGLLLSYSVNGQLVKEVPAGAAWQTVGGLRITQAGTWRIYARSGDGKLRAESNPIWVSDKPEKRIYWGETHAHSGMSEGQGSIDAFYTYGRDDARLDFLGLSEHDIWVDDFEWKQMGEAVRRYTTPGKFIAFLAYEWTAQRTNGGHHNVFFRSPEDRRRVPMARAWTLARLYQGLRTLYNPKDVLIIPHAHQAGEWRMNDPAMERLVEIMSCHGTFEWFGNYYLKRGYDVGFLAASDDHRTRPGLSGVSQGVLQSFGGLVAVEAKEKTAPSIFDALKDRATYAVTSADRILMDVSLNGVKPGRRGPAAEKRKIVAKISGTAPLDRVDIVKNGEVILTSRVAAGEMASKVLAQLSFESDSEPYIRDNPRGYRTWKGTVEVVGATLVDFTAHIDNRHVEYARRDASQPNRLQFQVGTRGRADILELSLDGVTAGTKVLVRTEAAMEEAVSPPSVRPAQETAPMSMDLSFGDLQDGLLVKPLQVGPHTDRVTLQLVNPNGPRDTNLEYVDQSPGQAGDYYYIRVSQRNGARAWSSPMWAGGEPVRQ